MPEEASELSEIISRSEAASRKPLSVFFDVTSSKYTLVISLTQIVIRLLSRVLMRLFYRLEVQGTIPYLNSQPLLIITNHKSYFDPLIISESIPVWSDVFPLRFIAKDQFFQNVISRLFFLSIGAFPAYYRQGIDKSLMTPLKVLRNSESLVFFPEGKCIRTEELGEGKIGAAVLAIKNPGAIILPIAISGSHRILNEGLFRRALVKVNIGQPFYVKDKLGPSSELTPESLTKVMMQEISNLYDPIKNV